MGGLRMVICHIQDLHAILTIYMPYFRYICHSAKFDNDFPRVGTQKEKADGII